MGEKYFRGKAGMRFAHILVEGQTEETFVKTVFNPYFLNFNINFTPIIVSTKRIKSGLKFKGGVSTYQKIKKDIRHIINDASAEIITTMFDYYGLPDDFPGKNTLPSTSCFEQAKHLEEAFAADINNPKFIPFIMLHEFEAFAFIDPAQFSLIFPDKNIQPRLMDIKNQFSSVEEINDGAATHPSQRIELLVSEYKKNLHGPIITKRIGINPILKQCAHFRAWVEKIVDFARKGKIAFFT